MLVRSLREKDGCGGAIARWLAMKDEGFKEGVGLRESDKLVSTAPKRTCFCVHSSRLGQWAGLANVVTNDTY
jgi:hypothetical protein